MATGSTAIGVEAVAGDRGEQHDEAGLDGGLVEAQPGQHAVAVLELEQGQQDVLGADVVVAEAQRLAERELERLAGLRRRTG